jgi:hypothetical protein
MPKQENTAINNLVNVSAGGRLESDPGENLFGNAPLFGEQRRPHMARQMEAQPSMTMRGAPPAAARAQAPQAARRRQLTSQHAPAYGPPSMPAYAAQQAPARQRPQQPSRGYTAQPSRARAAQPASVDSMQTIARAPYANASRDSLDGKPTISILPPHQRSGALPYAPTEPVRQLASRAPVHVPQPSVPVAPLPRRRAPAATPSVVPPEPARRGYTTMSAPVAAASVPALPAYAPAPDVGDPEELYATVPVERFAPPEPTALVPALPARGRRPFFVELAHTLRELAAPIGVLTVVAVFLGGYLAFDGQGGKKRTAAAVVSAPIAVPSNAAPASLADAVIAADPSLAPAQHVAEDAPLVPAPPPVAVAAEPAPVAAAEPAQVAAVEPVVDEAADEIEMDATKVSKKKRSARTHRARTTVEVEKKPVSTRSEKAAAKRASKVAEGELPPNVADKTDGGPGKLVVSADVPALIYLDGRNTNLTAPKKITVPAGKHKVTLLDPATRKAKTQDIEIVAGKTVTVEKQFN